MSAPAVSTHRPTPIPALRGVQPYATPSWPGPIDLWLDGNEGVRPPADLLARLAERGPDMLRRYPSRVDLETTIAGRWGVDPSRVLVTAGADEAIDRLCRAMLGPGRTLVVPVPTFEMLPRYARLTGAEALEPAWADGPYPVDAVLAAVDGRTGIIGVVSPNNPTGLTVRLQDLRRLSEAAPHAVVLLDHAYVEFAETDLTAEALALPNVVICRTLSKAWGLAGLRVGYALGPAEIIRWMRPAGGPYAVAGPSLALAADRLATGEGDVARFVDAVRHDRDRIAGAVREAGGTPTAGEGNFVFARFDDAGWARDALASLGIKVRGYPGDARVGDALRITCPGEAAAAGRVADGLGAALAPEAILFDLDGVVVDVSSSYRRAIVATAETFGVVVTPQQIAQAKARGGANNDWDLTRALLAETGVDVPREEVIARFERLYQGADGVEGLKRTESCLIEPAWLDRLAERFRLGVVTGRPRRDAIEALERYGLARHFAAVVCMEDGPSKPDPTVVLAAMGRLGVRRAWMIGDTVDDVRAARAAGVVPIGVLPPGDGPDLARDALTRAGAARVLEQTRDLESLLRKVVP